MRSDNRVELFCSAFDSGELFSARAACFAQTLGSFRAGLAEVVEDERRGALFGSDDRAELLRTAFDRGKLFCSRSGCSAQALGGFRAGLT